MQQRAPRRRAQRFNALRQQRAYHAGQHVAAAAARHAGHAGIHHVVARAVADAGRAALEQHDATALGCQRASVGRRIGYRASEQPRHLARMRREHMARSEQRAQVGVERYKVERVGIHHGGQTAAQQQCQQFRRGAAGHARAYRQRGLAGQRVAGALHGGIVEYVGVAQLQRHGRRRTQLQQRPQLGHAAGRDQPGSGAQRAGHAQQCRSGVVVRACDRQQMSVCALV